MPHYRDGTPAEVGDFVKGKSYNSGYEIVGTVLDLNNVAETSNLVVGWVESHPLPSGTKQGATTQVRVTGSGRIVDAWLRSDSGEARAFEKVV